MFATLTHEQYSQNRSTGHSKLLRLFTEWSHKFNNFNLLFLCKLLTFGYMYTVHAVDRPGNQHYLRINFAHPPCYYSICYERDYQNKSHIQSFRTPVSVLLTVVQKFQSTETSKYMVVQILPGLICV